jgi:hypothetical protein
MRRRLDHRLAGVALAVAMTVSACGGTPPTAEQAAMPVVAPTPAPLENGLYAVWGAAPDEASAHAAAGTQAHRVVAYDDRLGGETPAPPREFLALSPEVDVPFVLASAPSVGESDKGFASLEVTLAPDSARALEAFTRARMGHRVAVVIGGEVVSTHGVKAVVTGGRLQVTRCTDNACELLRTRLTTP